MSNKTTQANTQELAPSQRFSDLVIREYQGATQMGATMTDTQRRLIQNYFIVADRVLADAEQRRLSKNASNKDAKWNNDLPCTWQNVNMNAFALDCAFYARLGLDPLQKNHLFLIPYKNKKTNKYDMNLMEGFVGMELVAMKYALEKPLDVTCELVYKNDKFTIHKKSATNRVEGYDLEITNPFDRGEIVGGFGYIQYDQPEKNKLIVLSMADIMKRKNSGQGNAQFWGGEATEWSNGKKSTVELDGWLPEMCLKTVKRAVFNGSNIPIDSTKIDEAYEHIKRREVEMEEAMAAAEIEESANKGPVISGESLDIVEDADFTEVPEEPAPAEEQPKAKEEPAQVAMDEPF